MRTALRRGIRTDLAQEGVQIKVGPHAGQLAVLGLTHESNREVFHLPSVPETVRPPRTSSPLNVPFHVVSATTSPPLANPFLNRTGFLGDRIR